jgi:hypothetical protein
LAGDVCVSSVATVADELPDGAALDVTGIEELVGALNRDH